jgi:preprotein translocase subunit SecA
MNFLTKILGDPNEKIIKSLNPIIAGINSFEDSLTKL